MRASRATEILYSVFCILHLTTHTKVHMTHTNSFFTTAASPVGELTLTSDGEGLTGLYCDGQRYFPELTGCVRRGDLPVFVLTRAWLELYFSGEQPLFTPPLSPVGTDFQLAVWAALAEIPYGQTVSYADVAAAVGCKSARAVGSAVGRNPISVIVPCHRVVGKNGALTGYAGGLDRKRFLLESEGALHVDI